MKKCPECFVAHLDGADICDCGFRFNDETYKKQRVSAWGGFKIMLYVVGTGLAIIAGRVIASLFMGHA